MVHLYIGNGKGKTTAAIGLAVRMAGRGGKVLFMQFLKDGTSGEIRVLKKIAEVKHCYNSSKFLFEMDSAEREQVREDILSMLADVDVSKYNLIVMDEVLDCIIERLISEKELSKFFESNAEIVLTGRSASEKMKEKADYISDIVNIKHPFSRGVKAGMGIEY